MSDADTVVYRWKGPGFFAWAGKRDLTAADVAGLNARHRRELAAADFYQEVGGKKAAAARADAIEAATDRATPGETGKE